MATQDKLMKSLETLRKLSQIEKTSNSGNPNIKKEKIQLCTTITDIMVSSSIQLAPNFPMLLKYSMEILLELCNDTDSDIRMFIEECLNKLIRGTRDENVTKILIEFINEMKQNNSIKSLRTSIIKFSKLAHHIRPHKGKLYVLTLFPILMKISERSEETIHETLSVSLPKIIQVLGPFTTENEIKNLLKSFLENISNSSAVIKRTTATSIQNICLNCHKPYALIVYCIHIVLGFAFPLNENCDNHLILGVFGVLRLLIPSWWKLRRENCEKIGTDLTELKLDKLLQIYELCLHYFDHKDHNIVNFALETLTILLQNSTKELRTTLLNPSGLALNKTKSIHQSNQTIQHVTPKDEILPDSDFQDGIELLDSCSAINWVNQSELTVSDEKSNKTDFKNCVQINDDILEDNDLINYFSQVEIGSHNKIDENDQTENIPETLKSYASEDELIDQPTINKDIYVGNFDDEDVSLVYCARLIAKTFLLSGEKNGLISDKMCRISVKSSALLCFSSILNFFPKLLTLNLDKNANGDEHQKLSDILLYSTHSDPQLRGNIRILSGNYIVSIIRLQQRNNEIDESNITEFIKLIESGLDDHFSCTKQTLQSLQICLNVVLESSLSSTVVPLLFKLPALSKNPYWLIKVSLCELVSSLPYVTIHEATGSDKIQKNVLNEIIFECLSDSDSRVRNAAAKAVSQLIPRLYFGNDAITSKSVHYAESLLSNLYNESWITGNEPKKIVEEVLMPPFSHLQDSVLNSSKASLSKIVWEIEKKLLSSNNCKHTLFGCVETLSLLSTNFPCTSYKSSWNCFKRTELNCSNELLKLCLDLMYNSEIAYDIGFHTNLLMLASNLYAGYSISILKPQIETFNDDELRKWSMLIDSSLSEIFLKHVMKLFNICLNVIDESHQKHIKPIMLNLPTSSPMKRRKSDLDTSKMLNSPKNNENEKTDRKDNKEKSSMGAYSHLPHYVKIYESLKTSYGNFKTSLEAEASEKFLNMLRETLKSLSILMEIGSVTEFGYLAEDILNCLSSIFRILPSETVECVQQLLKSILGVNLTSGYSSFVGIPNENENEMYDSSFYQQVFLKPYNEILKCSIKLKETNQDESDGVENGSIHIRNVKKKMVSSKNLDAILKSHIKNFEPMVIKSLKQYTMTSDVKLQGNVLQLLSQLIQMKINYCLLDSEQIFINFVLSQFEFIEEGRIRNAEELVPKIFKFLVQLSYSKQHTKSIITVPKIIQLCDGLIASGQSSSSHCIPALKPIIEDIFLVRNAQSAVDLKELETTKEVLLAMLLRLIDEKEIVDLAVLILTNSKSCKSTDFSGKWSRWSNDVFNAVVSMLKTNKFKLDSSDSLNSLKRLVFVLNPCVFRNIDDLIVLLFQEPPTLDQDIVNFSRWLGRILIIFTILSQFEEDKILSKISALKGNFNANSVFENVKISSDPLNVSNSADFFQNLSPEIILVRFILRTISLAAKKCGEFISDPETENVGFFIEELAMFEMFCLYSFQSGFLSKTANTAVSVVERRKYTEECDALNIEPINEYFRNLIHFCPILSFQWCYFLTLINYKDRSFLGSVLQVERKKSKSINEKIVEIGSCIILCDFLYDNLKRGTDDICWILDNKTVLLVEFINETKISEFIAFVNLDPNLSQKFLYSVKENCLNSGNFFFEMKLLKSIENAHPNATNMLMNLLLNTIVVGVENSILSKEILKLINRKLELLLTFPTEKLRSQSCLQNINSIVAKLNVEEKCKLEVLKGLLDKINLKIAGTITEIQIGPTDLNSVENIKIDEEWYVEQIKSKLLNNDAKIGNEVAELLSVLNYEEQMEIMRNINDETLEHCMKFGANLIENNQNDLPDILKSSIDCLNIRISEYLKIIRESKVSSDFPFNKLHSLITCLSHYLNSVNLIPNSEDFIAFVLESLKFLAKNAQNFDFLNECLQCFDLVLKQNWSFNILNSSEFSDELKSSVSILFDLVQILSGNKIKCESEDSCFQLDSLISFLFSKNKNLSCGIPSFLLVLLKSIVVNLARFSVHNCYIVIPVKVWNKLKDSKSSPPPSLPPELLQEVDFLEEYIFRVNLLGWTNRQRFEETWMNLLSVLCNTPSDENNSDEINEIHSSIALAIQGISSMLVQTFLYPTPGWRNVSRFLHVSRNSPIKCDQPNVKKSKEVQSFIKKEFSKSIFEGVNSVFDEFNLEKSDENEYSIGQLSIKYFLKSFGLMDNSDESCTAYQVWMKRNQVLEKNSLDVNSCIQFLQDYFTQVMENINGTFNVKKITSLKLFNELTHSILIISDLFNDKSQFDWMYNTFDDLLKVHSNEDEIVQQYLIIGLCKAAAVLNPELEVYENVKKYLVQFLNTPFLTTQQACLNGLLYLIEGCVLHNISIGNISDELQLILPFTVEYLQQNLPSENSNKQSKTDDHRVLVWTLTFYIIENVEEEHIESTFLDNVLNAAMIVLFENIESPKEFNCVMKGIQRVIITKVKILEKIRKRLVNLLLDGLKNDNPSKAIQTIQLLFIYMYSDCYQKLPEEQNNPDNLVQTIEKFSALFEHIKKGYVSEVAVLCSLLPQVINDFFTPADILNKVICEFLSAQQPHQKLLSKVIFHLFQSAIRQNQLTLLQDWIVLSLPNFTQNFSCSMATWCLTCFFISASCNKWLTSFFPYVQTRIQRYENEDREMLCIAGSDFFRNLSNEDQKEIFWRNFNVFLSSL